MFIKNDASPKIKFRMLSITSHIFYQKSRIGDYIILGAPKTFSVTLGQQNLWFGKHWPWLHFCWFMHVKQLWHMTMCHQKWSKLVVSIQQSRTRIKVKLKRYIKPRFQTNFGKFFLDDTTCTACFLLCIFLLSLSFLFLSSYSDCENTSIKMLKIKTR